VHGKITLLEGRRHSVYLEPLSVQFSCGPSTFGYRLIDWRNRGQRRLGRVHGADVHKPLVPAPKTTGKCLSLTWFSVHIRVQIFIRIP